MYWFRLLSLLIRLYLRTEQSLHGTGHLVTAEFRQNATQVTSTQMPELYRLIGLLLQPYGCCDDMQWWCGKFSDPIAPSIQSSNACEELRFSLSTLLDTTGGTVNYTLQILETEWVHPIQSQLCIHYARRAWCTWWLPPIMDVHPQTLRRVTIYEKPAVWFQWNEMLWELLLHSIIKVPSITERLVAMRGIPGDAQAGTQAIHHSYQPGQYQVYFLLYLIRVGRNSWFNRW